MSYNRIRDRWRGDDRRDVVPAVNAPWLTSITPATGAAAGGTSVTLAGNRLTNCSAVKIGGTDCTNISVTNDDEVVCDTPAKAAGVYDVVLYTPGGPVTLTAAFTYT